MRTVLLSRTVCQPHLSDSLCTDIKIRGSSQEHFKLPTHNNDWLLYCLLFCGELRLVLYLIYHAEFAAQSIDLKWNPLSSSMFEYYTQKYHAVYIMYVHPQKNKKAAPQYGQAVVIDLPSITDELWTRDWLVSSPGNSEQALLPRCSCASDWRQLRAAEYLVLHRFPVSLSNLMTLSLHNLTHGADLEPSRVTER